MKEIAKERERMVARYVFLMDLAAKLKCSNSALHERAKRMGLAIVKIARPESCKAASVVSPEDAKRLIESIPQKAESVEIIDPADLMKE